MSRKLFKFIFLLVCLKFCVCINYNNYTLFRAVPLKIRQLNFLKSLAFDRNINFWKLPGYLDARVDFVVSPEAVPRVLNVSRNIGLNLITVHSNIQSAFDTQTVKPYFRSKLNTFHWNSYFRLDDIYQWLEDLAKLFPTQMKLLSIGNTQQSRNILGVRIALNGSCKLRSKVIIEGGIHGSEWISPAFVTCLIYKILYSHIPENKNLRAIAETYEWFIVPVMNPDGYEYSHTDDRLWNKNRNTYGVDLNRNFGYEFGSYEVSTDKRSQIYCGPRPLSEPESWSLADFIRTNKQGLEYYLAIHSYGQHLILPDVSSKDRWNKLVKKKCLKAAERMSSIYKRKYTVGTRKQIYGYRDSGSSDCWAKNEFKIPYVVTIALRDHGFYGFALPSSQIMPTCVETIEGVITLLDPDGPSFNASRHARSTKSGQVLNILDEVVIAFNMFLFIIVGFD